MILPIYESLSDALFAKSDSRLPSVNETWRLTTVRARFTPNIQIRRANTKKFLNRFEPCIHDAVPFDGFRIFPCVLQSSAPG